jgi:hypothetical protein
MGAYPSGADHLRGTLGAVQPDTRRTGKKLTSRHPEAVHLFTGFASVIAAKNVRPFEFSQVHLLQVPHKIREDDLEEIYHQQLKDFFFSSEEISKYLDKADSVIKEKQNFSNPCLTKRKKLRQEMDKIYQLYLDDKITKMASENGITFRRETQTNRRSTAGIQAEIDFLKIQYLSSDQILQMLRIYIPLAHPECRRKTKNH